MKLIRASSEHCQIVSELYLEFANTFGKPHLLAPFNYAKIINTAYQCVLHEDKCAFLLQDDAGEFIGLMMGFCSEFNYSSALYAQDRMFYVREGKRSLKALRLLLEAFTSWAKEKGCFSINLTALGSRNNEALVKLLHRWGYFLEGYDCIKRL